MAIITIAELRDYLDLEDTDTYIPDSGVGVDTLTLASTNFRNTLKTGTEVTVSSTTADPPAPLVTGTVYYVILGADQVIQLATTSALAIAGTAINLTDNGTGTHSITREDADTALLTDAISAAQTYIESQTNRVFEAATATRHYLHQSIDPWDSALLHVDHDLLTVTTLANGDGKGSDTYIPAIAPANTLALATAGIYSALQTGTPATVASTTNDPPAPLVEGTTYYVILTGSPVIQLAATGALAIAGTAIALTGAGTGTHTITFGGTLISNTNYWLVPFNLGPPYYAIQLKKNTGVYWEFDTDYRVGVTGTWGYSATPPGDIKMACLHLAAFYVRKANAQVFDVTAIPDAGVITIPQGIPATVGRIIDRYKRYL